VAFTTRTLEYSKERAMKQLVLLIPLVIGAALMLTQCGREAVSNNSMEEIYAEEGVPVRARVVEPKLFETSLSYHAALNGIEESSVYAMISDEVEEIAVEVGDFVEKDQLLLRFPKTTPSARYEQAKVAYENAKLTYERIEQLYRNGSVAEQDRDNAKTAYDVARADWQSVRDMVDVSSPIDGYVTRINVNEADAVISGDLLMNISQINRMRAKVWASDHEIVSIRRGQRATARWNDAELRGTVVQVDMAMDQDMRAFGVVLEFENPSKIFTVGVIADITIVTYSNPKALSIERKDIMVTGDRSFVYLVRDDRAHLQPIRIGKSQGLNVEVLEGLESGDLLITEGLPLLKQESKIRVVD
jgi:membrane fusion protein (multidrug efflux system)